MNTLLPPSEFCHELRETLFWQENCVVFTKQSYALIEQRDCQLREEIAMDLTLQVYTLIEKNHEHSVFVYELARLINGIRQPQVAT